MDDILNVILTEGEGSLSIYSCELDTIEEKNKRHLKTYHANVSSIWDENSCPCYIDKLSFCNFSCFLIMRHEQEGQNYSTSYYIKK